MSVYCGVCVRVESAVLTPCCLRVSLPTPIDQPSGHGSRTRSWQHKTPPRLLQLPKQGVLRKQNDCEHGADLAVAVVAPAERAARQRRNLAQCPALRPHLELLRYVCGYAAVEWMHLGKLTWGAVGRTCDPRQARQFVRGSRDTLLKQMTRCVSWPACGVCVRACMYVLALTRAWVCQFYERAASRLGSLAKQETVVEQMEQVTTVESSMVYCHECRVKFRSKPVRCTQQGHRLEERKVTLHFFKCSACGQKAKSSTRTYVKPCRKCGASGTFQPCSAFNTARAKPKVAQQELQDTGGPMIHSLRYG